MSGIVRLTECTVPPDGEGSAIPAESEADPLVGVVLGDVYQLVGRIGQGGMGAVYEAHHLRMRKRVAVKLLNRAMASKDEALARFRREAVVASRLGHPNLVNVLDFGSSVDGQPYLVMEFLEGEDLDRRIRRAGPIPLPSTIRISRQVAAAVSAVHAKGIVHRDLKPANIFLVHVPGEPDFVKVLDFGVSKIRASETKLTDASKTVGTPAYMSPEQAFGPSHAVDHRADQWALACIIWEMLSGHPPFSADDPDALGRTRRSRTTAIGRARPHVIRQSGKTTCCERSSTSAAASGTGKCGTSRAGAASSAARRRNTRSC